MPAVYKFGYSSADGSSDQPYVYGNVWATEPTSGGGRRLVMAPARDQVDLLSRLAERMTGPFGILYVLVVPRTGAQSGRYQSPLLETVESVKAFLSEFKGVLEGDGAHHLWIGAQSTGDMLVYDRHNVIYAYGAEELYKPVLAELGLNSVDEVQFPVPHSHHYNEAFDDEQSRLLSYWDWSHTPLRKSDEE